MRRHEARTVNGSTVSRLSHAHEREVSAKMLKSRTLKADANRGASVSPFSFPDGTPDTATYGIRSATRTDGTTCPPVPCATSAARSSEREREPLTTPINVRTFPGEPARTPAGRLPVPPDPLYRRQYDAGWRYSGSETATLDHGDAINAPDPWYDGYLDLATGRDKWHYFYCTAHYNAGGCGQA